MISGDIHKALLSLQDKGYRDMQITIIPTVNADSIIGVRTPALRSLAKELSKREDIDKFLNSLPHKYFEENQLHAFILSGMKDAKRAFELVDKFLRGVQLRLKASDLISFTNAVVGDFAMRS